MPRRGDFRVSVSKDYLVFASAHFITFAGHRCEGLHGHNYRARVTVEGAQPNERAIWRWALPATSPAATGTSSSGRPSYFHLFLFFFCYNNPLQKSFCLFHP